MTIEVKVPALPESVSDATVATWHVRVGDTVSRDQNIVDLETDKVVLEVPSTINGVIEEIICDKGKVVTSGQVLAKIREIDANAVKATAKDSNNIKLNESINSDKLEKPTSPSVRRMLNENDLDANIVKGTGKDGRITKEDVISLIENGRTAKAVQNNTAIGAKKEERVPMSRLRAKIAQRLVKAQHEAAMLTTFNEVNLSAVMNLRAKYKDIFEKKHGVKLGFMSFFTKAVVESLKLFPAINASIDGDDIVYHGYFDIGIAVSTERGLVVPVIRDVDNLSLAQIEASIASYAARARDGKLSIEDMQGGTFTITNGGVFGSLLATPILNSPQTGILGMHKIEERPVVENGEIVIRPMMYLALSYDHRLVDGKESVQFLVSVKSLLEDPMRLLLDI